jgi:chloramphenicol 3-O-phosphotransferase
MIVVLNGSFGVGKTTVARLLRGALAGSAIYDPELVGIVLRRLPTWLKLEGAGSGDFQNMPLWRQSAVSGTRLVRFVTKGSVLVPMAFSRRDYYDEFVAGIGAFDDVRVFCLRASLPTIERRLKERGDLDSGPGAEWIARRIVECAEAHVDRHFGEAVDTENRPARDVADEILERLNRKE